jgi:alpha-aminoadipate carrier protein LysW
MKVVPRESYVIALRPSLTGGEEHFLFIIGYSIEFQGGTQFMANCPECEAQIIVQGLMVGEIIYCPDCNAELEVLNLEQPAVALAPQVEEDWGE